MKISNWCDKIIKWQTNLLYSTNFIRRKNIYPTTIKMVLTPIIKNVQKYPPGVQPDPCPSLFEGDDGDNVLELLSNCAVMNDFMYHKRRQEENKIYWHCRRKDCHATMITDSKALSGEAKLGHCHPKEPQFVERVKALQRLKAEALNRKYASPTELVKEYLANVGEECAKIMPEQKSLCSCVWRWRKGLK